MTFQTAVAGEKITLAQLFKVTYADGGIFYFTSYERDITWSVDGNTYLAIPIKADPAKKDSDLSTGEIKIIVPRSAEYLSVEQLFNRYLDNAEVIITWIDRNIHTNYTVNFVGEVGEVNYNKSAVDITLKNELNMFRKKIPRRLYSESCDFSMYDSDCKLLKSNFVATGTIEFGSTTTIINDATRTEDDRYFDLGYVEITSGADIGHKRFVCRYEVGEIEVLIPFLHDNVGEDYRIYPHCKKTFDSCRDDFSNQLNFGGFQNIPKPSEVLV
jgi:uncharacterized phage protein (TIGR02218 family)